MRTTWMSKGSVVWFVGLLLFLHNDSLAVRIDPSTKTSSLQDIVTEHRRLEERPHEELSSQDSQQQQHRRRRTVSVTIPTNPDDHLVTNLPLSKDGQQPLSTKQWAGHLPANDSGEKYLFYWLFAPDLADSNVDEHDVPLVIWLNGGPGCSSMDGLFLENGPLRLLKTDTGEYKVVAAETSWHQVPAYTLYIDQPVGTGLSFTTDTKGYPTNDEQVNIDFYYFLQSFFTLHADKFVTLKEDPKPVFRDVYFSGESHAGHYIPSMMHYIVRKNDDNDNSNKIVIPLAGAAIGNGWTDPYHQYAAAEIGYAHGFIGRAQLNALNEKEKECQRQLNEGKYTSSICFNLLSEVQNQAQGTNSNYKPSSYDARLSEPKGHSREFPPGHKVVETYLGGWPLKHDSGISQDVYQQTLEAIHASAASDAGQRYKECTDPPFDALAHQDGLGVVDDVIALLEYPNYKIRLLFFNGMEDMICNHDGNEKFLENMAWKGRDMWIESKRYVWISQYEQEGKVSGYMKEYDNLLFLKILNAGHMVPLDVPLQSLDMMQLFIHKDSFQSSPQTILGKQASADAHCPVCPSCSEPDCDDSCKGQPASLPPSGNAGSLGNSRLIAVVLAVSGIALAVIYISFFRRKRRSGSIVPQYDLELRDTSYSDSPGPVRRISSSSSGNGFA